MDTFRVKVPVYYKSAFSQKPIITIFSTLLKISGTTRVQTAYFWTFFCAINRTMPTFTVWVVVSADSESLCVFVVEFCAASSTIIAFAYSVIFWRSRLHSALLINGDSL